MGEGTNIDVPRLYSWLAIHSEAILIKAAYLTSPFLRWFMSMWMPSIPDVSFEIMYCGGNPTLSEHACGHHHGGRSFELKLLRVLGSRKFVIRFGGVVKLLWDVAWLTPRQATRATQLQLDAWRLR